MYQQIQFLGHSEFQEVWGFNSKVLLIYQKLWGFNCKVLPIKQKIRVFIEGVFPINLQKCGVFTKKQSFPLKEIKRHMLEAVHLRAARVYQPSLIQCPRRQTSFSKAFQNQNFPVNVLYTVRNIQHIYIYAFV